MVTVERTLIKVDGISVEVLIIDNDPDSSARDVAKKKWDAEIAYFVEPAPGITAARNRALLLAQESDFIVFVDDDETVSEDWLQQLLLTQTTFGADIVAGPVHPILPNDSPQWLKSSGVISDRCHRDGAILREAACGNTLFRMELFNARPSSQWFLQRFNLTGGEDAELTRRLVREGAVIVWASKAEAFEVVGPERQTLRWISRRYRRIGGVDYVLSGDYRFKRLRIGLGGGILRVLSGSLCIGYKLITKHRIDGDGLKRFFRGLGFMEAAFMGVHEEYGRVRDFDAG